MPGPKKKVRKRPTVSRNDSTASIVPGPIANLPQELLTLIMEQVKSSPTVLKNCALVCRTWRSPAQRYLFASVLLRDHISCNNMNRLFKTSSHLVPYVNQITIQHHGGPNSDFLGLRGAIGFIESCPNIRTLTLDVRFVPWNDSSHEFVISKLKTVEKLIVKGGEIAGVDLKDIFNGLPSLRVFELYPAVQYSFRRFGSSDVTSRIVPVTSSPLRLQELALSSVGKAAFETVLRILVSPGVFDSSILRVLKLGWLTEVPSDPLTIQLLKEFTHLHGSRVQCLTLFGTSNSFDVTEFAKALASLKAIQDLTVLISLTKAAYSWPAAPFRVLASHVTSPVQGLTGLLSGVASSTLRNVILKLVLRTDDMGSNADWEAINLLLCDDQRFPDLHTVTLNVMLVHYELYNLPEVVTFTNCIATMNSRIHSCMPNLLSSGKLSFRVTLHHHRDKSLLHVDDPMYHW